MAVEIRVRISRLIFRDLRRVTGADGGHVIRLQVVNNVLDAVDALLNSEVELVVLRSELFGNLAGIMQVGGALQGFEG